jgi:hypothetical protein
VHHQEGVQLCRKDSSHSLKATELGLCPEEDLSAANSSLIQFGCIMTLKLIRNQSLRLGQTQISC